MLKSKGSTSNNPYLVVVYAVCLMALMVVAGLCYATFVTGKVHVTLDATHWSTDNFVSFAGKTVVILTAWSGVILFLINKIYDFKDAAIARQQAEHAAAQAEAAKAQTVVNAAAINNHAEQINGRLTVRSVAASSAAVTAALELLRQNPNASKADVTSAAAEAAYHAAKAIENDNPVSAASVSVPVAGDSGVARPANGGDASASTVVPFPVK